MSLVSPDREPGLQPELPRVAGIAAQGDDGAVRQAEDLADLAEHQGPSEGRGQGRDQRPVIAARGHAGESAGGVAAQAVGHQPLAGHQGRGERLGSPVFLHLDFPPFQRNRHDLSFGLSTTAAWPGSRHPPSRSSGGGAPQPP
jgi:hypothetical protein